MSSDLALALFGIHYAVAALGTAASQAHLDLLFRFCSELVFCFDGDKAGREAAWRVMESVFSSLKDGRQIRIMLLPEHHDPDSLVREEGADGFTARVQASETLSEFFFGHVSKELNLSKMEGRAQLVTKAKPYLEKLPESVFKEMMFAQLKELSGWAGLDVLGNTATLSTKQRTRIGGKRFPGSGRLSSARTAVALLVQNPRLAELLELQEINWRELEFSGSPLFKNILQMIADKNPASAAVLVECYRDTAEEKSIKALALLELPVPDEGIESEFFDALDRLITQDREAVLARLLEKEKSQGLDAQEKKLLLKMFAAKLIATK